MILPGVPDSGLNTLRNGASDKPTPLVMDTRGDSAYLTNDLKNVMREAEATKRFEALDKLLDQEFRETVEEGCFFEKEECIGSSLTFAVKLGLVKVTKMLLTRQPDRVVDTYKLDGGDGKLLTLPLVAAAISAKNESIFKLLHENNAAIDGDGLGETASSDDWVSKKQKNWNLLYEASYHGCLPIIKYLRQHSRTFQKDLEAKVQGRNVDSSRKEEVRSMPFTLASLYDLAHPYEQVKFNLPTTPEEQTRPRKEWWQRKKTPLTCAVWRGHRDVVKALLQMDACSKPDDYGIKGWVRAKESDNYENPTQIVREPWTWMLSRGFEVAINTVDLQMIRLLVVECVDVFAGKAPPPQQKGGDLGHRSIDYIFDKGNPLIVAEVVAGLREKSKSSATSANFFSNMQINDFLRILMMKNCDGILDVIFQEKIVADREEESKDKKEFDKKSLDYHDSVTLTICEGRSSEGFAKPDLDAEGEDQLGNYHKSFKKFMQVLLPDAQAFNDGVTPISIRQCVIPNAHRDARTAWILAHPPNNAIFEYPGAQALVKYMWGTHEHWYFYDFVCNFAMAAFFLMFAFIINQGAEARTRYLLGACALVLWIRSLVMELLQMIGDQLLGTAAGHLKNKAPETKGCCSSCRRIVQKSTFLQGLIAYFGDIGNWIDIARLSLTGFGIIGIFNAEALEIEDHMGLRICFGCVMFLLWTKVLYSQRGFEFIGPTMFPIQAAVSATWPFLFMMFWPAVGFAQGYYMLNVYPEYFRAATLVYRAGFLGDIDVEEVEDIDPSFYPSEDNEGFLEVEDPEWTEYHVVFIAFTVIVSLGFTVIMMNILIGVLSAAYDAAYQEKERLFLQSRAAIVFEARAVKRAWVKKVCCGRNRCKSRKSRSLWATTPQDLHLKLVKKVSIISDAWLDKGSDEDINAMRIQDAIKGMGTREDQLIRVICPMDIQERQKLKEAYFNLFGEDMVKNIEKDTNDTKKFQKAILKMLEVHSDPKGAPPPPYDEAAAKKDCEDIFEAMDGKADDHNKLVELVCGKTKQQMELLNKHFPEHLRKKESKLKSLHEFIQAETSLFDHHFQAAMLGCIKPSVAQLDEKEKEVFRVKTNKMLESKDLNTKEKKKDDEDEVKAKKFLWYCQSTVVRPRSKD